MMKYIFVIAEDADISADEIIHWILSLSDFKVIRINETDRVELIDIDTTDGDETTFSISINGNISVYSRDIAAYWYRRGCLSYPNVQTFSADNTDDTTRRIYENVDKYYKQEWEHITDYIHYLLRHSGIPSLNSFLGLETNKLINIEMAKKLGLRVPHSIITNNIDRIRTFISEHDKVISKPINFPGSGGLLGEQYLHYSQKTNLFTLEDLEERLAQHTRFQPTLFQEYMEKDFEIRTFYLKGSMYSMAIFSQDNEQTKVDFRDYDELKPNRNVPFILPADIEDKLRSLMQKLDLDTGSFDFIYHNGVYIFLEVNTVGQFQWLSKRCNYYLEKNIAQELIQYATTYEHRY